MMQESQFSIKRLLYYIALLSVVLSIASAFPVATASVTVKLLLVAPTMAVAAAALWLSRNRLVTMIAVALGAFSGWLLAPRIQIGPLTFWDRFLLDFSTVGILAAGGAFIFALVDLGTSRALRKS